MDQSVFNKWTKRVCGLCPLLLLLCPGVVSAGLVMTTEAGDTSLEPHGSSAQSFGGDFGSPTFVDHTPRIDSADEGIGTQDVDQFILRGAIPVDPQRMAASTPFSVDEVLETLTLADPLLPDAAAGGSDREQGRQAFSQDLRADDSGRGATRRSERVPPMPARPLTLALGVLWLVSLCRRLVPRQLACSAHEGSTDEGSTGHGPYDYSLLETMLPAIGCERDELHIASVAQSAQPATSRRGGVFTG